MEDWVFIDTCIWAAFFARPNSAEKRAVDSLLDHDRIALVGPIVAEVLLGFRRKEQADWIASRLRLAHYVTAEWSDWCRSAELGRELAAKGQKLPPTDLVVATVAKRLDAFVYTVDPHFDSVPGLKRYWPS